MLVSLLLAAPLVRQTCADCALVKNDVLPCPRHVEEERAAFTDTRKRLSSEQAAERIAALEELSKLTKTRVNAPSERVARRIADFLADESREVRERAASLLGPPQHAIASMQALLEALSTEEKDMRRLQVEQANMRKKGSRGPTLREKQEKDLDADLARNEAEQESLLEWRRTVVGRLGGFPDDRVVTALCEITHPLVAAPGKARETEESLRMWMARIKADQGLPRAMDLNGALVRLGNREAIRTVAVNLGVLQSEIADLEGAHVSLSSLQDIVQSMRRELTDARDRSKQEIVDALEEKHLEDVQAASRALPWILDWMERNTASFPEHLPGVVSPAW